MKTSKRAILGIAIVFAASSLFAAEPQSFLKDTTYGLFEDENVDKFAYGVENAEGIVLGEFDSADYGFSIGAGSYIGPFWYSIYDSGSFGSTGTKNQTVTNDAVSKDAINTDYVDTDTTVEKYKTNNIANDLYASMASDDWGVQAYWLFRDNSNTNDVNRKNSESKEYDTASETLIEHKQKTAYFNGSNTFGANFSGIATDGDLYFQLNNVELIWKNEKLNKTKKDVKKVSGSIYNLDANDNKNYEGKSSFNTITQVVSGEMGLPFINKGNLSSNFVLEDSLTLKFLINKGSEVTKSYEEDYNTQTVTTVKTVQNYKTPFMWRNVITPKFLFDIDVGEKLDVKAGVSAELGFGTSLLNTDFARNNITTTTTETVVKDKMENTTTKTKRVQDSVATYVQTKDVMFTYIIPKTNLAFVYKVNPGKFHINMGLEWGPGQFSWTTTTTKNETLTLRDKTTETNEYGESIVTSDTVQVRRQDGIGSGDATEESKKTVYSNNGTWANELKLGATWFITENTTFDIAYSNVFTDLRVIGITGNDDSLLNGNLKMMISVKF